MKKIWLSLIIAFSLVCTMIIAVFASNLDAFKPIEMNGNTEIYINNPDTDEKGGGGGNPISFVEGFGCGYSSLGDIVMFKDVDFGSTGAKSMSILFSFGSNSGITTDLEIYMDDYSDEAFLVGSVQIGFTGGWGIEKAQNISFPCVVDPGVHNIYVKFITPYSGSFSQIQFSAEGDGEVETEAPYDGEKIKDAAFINIFNENIKKVFYGANATEVSYTENGVKFVATEDTSDPYVTVNFKQYWDTMGVKQLSATDYPYMVVKLRADPNTTSPVFENYANCNDVYSAGDYSAVLRTGYEATGDWEYVLCDFSECEEWNGVINNIRFDWNISCEKDCFMEICEIKFCRNEDEIYAYIDGLSAGTTASEEATTEEATTAVAETTAEETTAAELATTAAEQATTAVTEEKKTGCGSVIALVAPMCILAAGVMICKKKN